jgi:hypothetical protein
MGLEQCVNLAANLCLGQGYRVIHGSVFSGGDVAMNNITAKRAAQMSEKTGKAGSKAKESAGVPHDLAHDVGAQCIAPLHHGPGHEGELADNEQSQDISGNHVTITCPLCEAQFMPEPEHAYLNSVKADALDAAFQSMCHVCFRCHRSACPQCWDNIHRVCGACVLQAGLAFRSEVAPLAGLLFPPARQTFSSGKQLSATPFVCIQPGRFEVDRSSSSGTDTPAAIPSLNGKENSVADYLPSGETRSAQAPQPLVIHHSRPYEVSQGGLRRFNAQHAYEDVDKDFSVGFFARMLRIVERIVTIVLFLVLLAVVVATVLAEGSGTVNAWFERFVHVDIRAEVAYVMALIRQIHW